jgi:hypothetical protein
MEPKLMGRSISMTISPLPANKRKRKFGAEESEEALAPELDSEE